MKKFAIAACLALAAVSANAGTELVANGSFETGDLTGWDLTGFPGFSLVERDNSTSNTSYAWLAGAVGSYGFLSQNIQTVAGRTYTLSFDVYNDITDGMQFTSQFNGAEVYSFSNEARNWDHIVISNLQATGNLTEIKFGFRNDPAFSRLDNISVQAMPVPEPETYAMLIAGLGMLAWLGKRRKTA
ncbi:MAG: hypothetical protein RL748_4141 [Pseudomonadota bacterium]